MAGRRAVLIPGRGYDTRYALFFYGAEALHRAGFITHEISWQVPDDFDVTTAGAWVVERVAPALAEPADLLVGKSLGTLAVSLAAERGVSGIWFTPLLHRPEVVDALERATAPFLLVGGTADSSWNGPLARRLTPHVVEIPDADHSLMVPGPLAESAEALGRVCTAVEEFVAGPLVTG